MKKISVLFAAAVFLLIWACKKDEDSCNTTNITYGNTVEAILDKNCTEAACHGASLASYDSVVNFVYINRMLGALKHEAGFNPMPGSGGKLSDCEISQIEAWFNAGKPR